MNAFQVLGLKSTATATDIKAAYRKLAQINHPDKCGAPGATEALKAINVAYAWITKGGRRAPEFAPTLVIFRSAEECEAAAVKAAKADEEAAAKAAKPARKTGTRSKSPKMAIRAALEAGEWVYVDAWVAKGYTEKQIRDALSYLKNAEYCGKGLAPLNIVKTGGGGYYAL